MDFFNAFPYAAIADTDYSSALSGYSLEANENCDKPDNLFNYGSLLRHSTTIINTPSVMNQPFDARLPCTTTNSTGLDFNTWPSVTNILTEVPHTPIAPPLSSPISDLCLNSKPTDEVLAMLSYPSPSPRSPKRRLPVGSEEHGAQEAESIPRRKRGRPRLDRKSTSSLSSSCDSPNPHEGRLLGRTPHNEVERRYRDGLNTELDRLRRAVPTIPQGIDSNIMSTVKPTKAVVLAAAIEYITKLEKERNAAVKEIERLGGAPNLIGLVGRTVVDQNNGF